MTIAEAIANSRAADRAFEDAVKGAGYKSRWDWNRLTDSRPLGAYAAKVAADELMHNAFVLNRAQ